MAEAVEARSDEQIAAFADDLVKRPEWKHIVRLLKNDVIMKWANEKDADERDMLWHRIQAVGALETKVSALKDEHTIFVRKQEAAKRKTPGG